MKLISYDDPKIIWARSLALLLMVNSNLSLCIQKKKPRKQQGKAFPIQIAAQKSQTMYYVRNIDAYVRVLYTNYDHSMRKCMKKIQSNTVFGSFQTKFTSKLF